MDVMPILIALKKCIVVLLFLSIFKKLFSPQVVSVSSLMTDSFCCCCLFVLFLSVTLNFSLVYSMTLACLLIFKERAPESGWKF